MNEDYFTAEIFTCPKCKNQFLFFKYKGDNWPDEYCIGRVKHGGGVFLKYSNGKILKYTCWTIVRYKVEKINKIFCKCGFQSSVYKDFLPKE